MQTDYQILIAKVNELGRDIRGSDVSIPNILRQLADTLETAGFDGYSMPHVLGFFVKGYNGQTPEESVF